MNTHIDSPPATDEVMALVRGELTSARRWLYRGVLVAAILAVAVIVSLWTTEPRPLPLRLHVAFAALTLIGVSWVGVITWIVSRRYCPTAFDRIATGWVATGACTLFVVVAGGIAWSRHRVGEVAWVTATGLALLLVAVGMLGRAYAERRRLRLRLAQLPRETVNDSQT